MYVNEEMGGVGVEGGMSYNAPPFTPSGGYPGAGPPRMFTPPHPPPPAAYMNYAAPPPPMQFHAPPPGPMPPIQGYPGPQNQV